jgi:D-serine deaminase-like pyridoxal phosphate-dependent protein
MGGGLMGTVIPSVSVPTEVLAELPTPCLVVDLPAAERNIARAREILRGTGIALRPHFKAHKCTRLMRLQVQGDASPRVACQTAWEARTLALAGFRDILVANQVVDEESRRWLANAATTSRITVAIDSARHVELLSDTAQRFGCEFGVVIELDVGAGRCGLAPDSEDLLALADAVTTSRGLEFVGLLAYEGHVSLKEDPSLRRTLLWQVAQQVAHERARLAAAGFHVDLVTGGATGTLDLIPSTGSHSEAQAGTYVLMDATYARCGVPFEMAVMCLATVISARDGSRLVLDAGLKSISAEYGLPVSLARGMRVLSLADEHARVAVDSALGIGVADRVLLQPAHLDPTVNLHSHLQVWDGKSLEAWRVDGRLTSE